MDPSVVPLTLFIGWMLAIFIGLLGLAVLYYVFTGKIDLTCLLCESTITTPVASMARFQFLIFTFVIALCLFLVTVGNKCGIQFPKEIPAGILALLGISGGSYVVGKGIQASASKPGTPGATGPGAADQSSQASATKQGAGNDG